MADITILGSGGFGLALAIMCDNAGHKVTVWSKFHGMARGRLISTISTLRD